MRRDYVARREVCAVCSCGACALERPWLSAHQLTKLSAELKNKTPNKQAQDQPGKESPPPPRGDGRWTGNFPSGRVTAEGAVWKAVNAAGRPGDGCLSQEL